MLLDFLTRVCQELDISPVPEMNEEKFLSLPLGDEVIEIRDLKPGLSLFGIICLCPEKKKEELFLKLSKANFLGQETGPTRIGMSSDEKYLTLSLAIPYELTYTVFREYLEDFVGFIVHWRTEVTAFKKLETLL
jgi:hypothetical protein